MFRRPVVTLELVGVAASEGLRLALDPRAKHAAVLDGLLEGHIALGEPDPVRVVQGVHAMQGPRQPGEVEVQRPDLDRGPVGSARMAGQRAESPATGQQRGRDRRTQVAERAGDDVRVGTTCHGDASSARPEPGRKPGPPIDGATSPASEATSFPQVSRLSTLVRSPERSASNSRPSTPATTAYARSAVGARAPNG